jgi:hypothetical protein
LKKGHLFHPTEYIVVLKEGVDVAFVALLILMMHDMESMLVTINFTSFSIL